MEPDATEAAPWEEGLDEALEQARALNSIPGDTGGDHVAENERSPERETESEDPERGTE